MLLDLAMKFVWPRELIIHRIAATVSLRFSFLKVSKSSVASRVAVTNATGLQTQRF